VLGVIDDHAVAVPGDGEVGAFAQFHLLGVERRHDRSSSGHGLDSSFGMDEHHGRVTAVDRSAGEVQDSFDGVGDGGFLVHRQDHLRQPGGHIIRGRRRLRCAGSES